MPLYHPQFFEAQGFKNISVRYFTGLRRDPLAVIDGIRKARAGIMLQIDQRPWPFRFVNHHYRNDDYNGRRPFEIRHRGATLLVHVNADMSGGMVQATVEDGAASLALQSNCRHRWLLGPRPHNDDHEAYSCPYCGVISIQPSHAREPEESPTKALLRKDVFYDGQAFARFFDRKQT